MDYLENVTVDELHEILADVDEKKPVQRVLTGIAYKDGATQKKIAERHDVHPNTVRNWLIPCTTILVQDNHATSTKMSTNGSWRCSTTPPKRLDSMRVRGLFH